MKCADCSKTLTRWEREHGLELCWECLLEHND